MKDTDYRVSLLAGGVAGTAVDVSLFPLDTIKTRLQSEAGFFKSGGFRGIYSGLPSVLIGSAPTAALFFTTYEGVKNLFNQKIKDNQSWEPGVHMTAASCGEVAACFIRVPVEVVKQRAQASQNHSSVSILRSTLKSEGFAGLYRGYFSTVFREIPFSFIQFPLWEFIKKKWSEYQKRPVDPWQSAVCGSVSGCFSSGITTPLDVAKTRIMLAKTGSDLAKGHIVYAIHVVYKQNGMKGLFAGVIPRMTWISIGGAIFLGVYDKMKLTFNNILETAH